MQQQLEARLSKPSRYDTMSGRQAYRELFRVRTFTLSPCRPESGRSSTGASARGHRRSSSATDMSVAQSATAISLLALGGLAGVLLSGWLADYLTFRGFRAGACWSAGWRDCSRSRCSR